MTTPESYIYVFRGVPLDNTYRNVIRGGISILNLENFPHLWWSGQTWIRIVGQYNNKVRVDCSPTAWGESAFRSDYLFNYNYIAIKNASYKSIFGFITDVLYINDNVAEITFEIDVFHTYYTDYTFCPCFVERATPDTSWSPASYAIPDYTQNSEYQTIAQMSWSPASNAWNILLMFAPSEGTKISDQTHITLASEINGKILGCYCIAVPAYGDTAFDLLLGTLNNVYNKGFKCINAFYVPENLILDGGYFRENILQIDSSDHIGGVANSYNNCVQNMELNGARITNKKIFTFPYTALEVTNNCGYTKLYAYEGFSNNVPRFEALGIGIPTPSITLVPINYFGKNYDFDNSITIDNFPQVPVQADTIASWSAQNSTANVIRGLSGAVGGAIIGAQTGGPVGGVIGAVLGGGAQAVNASASGASAKNTPSSMTSSGGSSNILLTSAVGVTGFTFRHVSLRYDCIRAIDDYFTRYGIAENRVITPPIERTVSGKYHYIKTSGCTIKCKSQNGIPVWAEKKICEIHDNGVTYWHSLSDVGSY